VIGGANTHARAVLPAASVQEHPYSSATSRTVAVTATSGPGLYDDVVCTAAPSAAAAALLGTAAQNDARRTVKVVVSTAVSGVASGWLAGRDPDFSGVDIATPTPTAAPVTTTAARAARGKVRDDDGTRRP
jgi:hypothetical protein